MSDILSEMSDTQASPLTKDFKIDLPEDVSFIINTIEKNGHQAYAVGGCVRDTIMGVTPNDWDITTNALPEEVKSYFTKTIDTGIQHGTVTVILHSTGYEVTTYRIDGDYLDGRHPSSVEFSDRLTDDLCRRDFTINAMAYNERTGLVDEYGGIDDINNKVIRCVGRPEERFTEDALRMMRAIRFSAQLGFTIEDNTYKAIEKLSANIQKVSMERVCVELKKTLMSDNPDFCRLYGTTNLFKDILPQLHDSFTKRQSKRILLTCKYSEKELPLRLTACLSNSTPAQAEDTLRHLRMDNKTIETVVKILTFSKDNIEETEPAIREALHKCGRDIFELVIKYDFAFVKASEEVTFISNPARYNHLVTLKRMADEILSRGDCFTIKDLDITGLDLIEYGLKGTQIGSTLNYLLDIVIENPKLNDKATLIGLLDMK